MVFNVCPSSLILSQGTTERSMFQLVVSQDTKVFLGKTDFQSVAPQCILVPGIIPPYVGDSAFCLVELHESPRCPVLQHVKAPLNSGTTIWCRSHSSLVWIICELTEGALPILLSIS